MSHQTKITTRLRDKRSLLAAAKRLGCTVQQNAKWRIYGGTSQQKADYVFSHPHCQYDVAALKQKDGTYTLSSDWNYAGYGKQTTNELFGENGERLVQATTVEAAKFQAMMQGYTVQEQTQADGTILLTCTSYQE